MKIIDINIRADSTDASLICFPSIRANPISDSRIPCKFMKILGVGKKFKMKLGTNPNQISGLVNFSIPNHKKTKPNPILGIVNGLIFDSIFVN